MKPHLEFPTYTRNEIVSILSKEDAPETEITRRHVSVANWNGIWSRFLMAVCIVLSPGMDMNPCNVRDVASRLWPRFLFPVDHCIENGTDITFSVLFLYGKHILSTDEGLEAPLTLPSPHSEGMRHNI